MSSLIVEVCEVANVEPHPNADRMCIVTVKGWKVCAGRDPETGKNQFEQGDKCIYLPPDSMLPVELSDLLGVTKYLGSNGRLKVANLRGVKSQGLIMALDDPSLEVGTDVAERLGITKYEPPPPRMSLPGGPQGYAASEVQAFHRYYDMENLRNFPELFADGEEVVATEKVHGTNVRLGLIYVEDEGGRFEYMAGSHNVRRKCPNDDSAGCRYWGCMNEQLRRMMLFAASSEVFNFPATNVVVYGELFGKGIQDLSYGLEKPEFRAFDIAVNGQYLGYVAKLALFASFSIPTVPVIYRGPYKFELMEELCEGPTTICEPEKAGPFKGREGIVVTSVVERTASLGKRFFSRAQAKMVSFAYHNRKNGTEYH